MYNRLVFCLISLVFIVSCASKKDVYYFQDIDQTPIENNFSLINIQPGDILDIQIKALNQESVLIFQRQGNLGLQMRLYLQNRVLDGYIVGDDGTINIPLLGSINTKIKLIQAFANDIQLALSSFIKNPSVNVRILNFRVSILGEVNQPGTLQFLKNVLLFLKLLV